MTTYTPQSWNTGDQVTAAELTDLSKAVTSASSGIADMAIDQSTSHLQVTLADGDLVDAGAVPAASDGTVAPILQNTSSASYAAVETTIDQHLGGDATGLITEVRARGLDASKYSTLVDAVSDATAVGANTVFAPDGSYPISSTLTVPSGMTITGAGPATKLTFSTPSTADGIALYGSLSNVSLNTNGNIAYRTVRIYSDFASVTNCAFTDNFVSTQGGIYVDSYKNVTLSGNSFSGFLVSILARGPLVDCTICDNNITNWSGHGIWVNGSTAGSSDGLLLSGNRVTGMIVPAASPRYPIVVEGATNGLHTNMVVQHNYVVGTGTAYTDATTPGTADQIALTGLSNGIVMGNTSINGGDGGMTCVGSTGIVIADNAISDAVVCGLYVGMPSSPSSYVTTTGNVITGSPTGIRLYSATACGTSGNVLGNGSGTMTAGVSITNSTNIILGPDINGATKLYSSVSGNTSVSAVSTAAVA